MTGNASEDLSNERVLAAVRDAAGDAVRDGDAALEHERTSSNLFRVVLRPRRHDACPMTIEAGPRQIDLFLGRDGWLHELWAPSVEARLAELRRCVAAVVRGDYAESVLTRPARQVGRFVTPDGIIEFSHSGAHVKRASPGTRCYAPYGAGGA